MKEQVSSSKAPLPIGPYSQGIIASGKLLFISEQIGLMPDGNLAGETTKIQTRQAIENIKAIVEAAGGSLENIIRTTLFLNNMDDFSVVNEVYAGYFNESKPARAAIEVSRLPKDALIGIDAIALLP